MTVALLLALAAGTLAWRSLARVWRNPDTTGPGLLERRQRAGIETWRSR